MKCNVDYFTCLRKYAQSDLLDSVEVHVGDKVICLTKESKVYFDFREDIYKFTDVLIGDGTELAWQLDKVDTIQIKSEDIKGFAI